MGGPAQPWIYCPICGKKAYLGSINVVSGSATAFFFCDRTAACDQNVISPVTTTIPM